MANQIEIFHGEQFTTIVGTPGDDLLIGTAGQDSLVGGRGNDTVFGEGGNDQLLGGSGNDRLDGGPGFDNFDGGPGIDTVSYVHDPAGVRVELGPQFSQATDGTGAFDSLQRVENVEGSAFGDTLLGNDETNVLRGGAGLDVLDGGAGDDVLDGGADGAVASWARADGPISASIVAGEAIEGDGARDVLLNITDLAGSAFGDLLVGDGVANRLAGGAGDDRLLAGGGNDVLVGGAGNDQLAGGTGRDLADYFGPGPVRVSLAAGNALDGQGGFDTLSGIEDLRGSLRPDLLIGDDGANRIEGGGGADTVRGLAGADVFAFAAAIDLGDRILDFEPGVDRIEVARGALPGGAVDVAWDPVSHVLSVGGTEIAVVNVAPAVGDVVVI